MLFGERMCLLWRAGIWTAKVSDAGASCFHVYFMSSWLLCNTIPRHQGFGELTCQHFTGIVTSLLTQLSTSMSLHSKNTPGSLCPFSPGLCPMNLYPLLILRKNYERMFWVNDNVLYLDRVLLCIGAFIC